MEILHSSVRSAPRALEVLGYSENISRCTIPRNVIHAMSVDNFFFVEIAFTGISLKFILRPALAMFVTYVGILLKKALSSECTNYGTRDISLIPAQFVVGRFSRSAV